MERNGLRVDTMIFDWEGRVVIGRRWMERRIWGDERVVRESLDGERDLGR
jgi:hypothetical protein